MQQGWSPAPHSPVLHSRGLHQRQPTHGPSLGQALAVPREAPGAWGWDCLGVPQLPSSCPGGGMGPMHQRLGPALTDPHGHPPALGDVQLQIHIHLVFRIQGNQSKTKTNAKLAQSPKQASLLWFSLKRHFQKH